MRKEQLTEELKGIKEDFVKLSREELTEDDLYTIKEITNSRVITKDTVPALLFALQSHLLLVEEGKTELNTEFVEEVNILVAKLQNNKFGILDKVERYIEMKDELDEYICDNDLYYFSELRHIFGDDVSVSKGVIYLNHVHRIGKINNIKDIYIEEDFDDDTPWENCSKTIMIERSRGKDNTLIITYNPFQKIIDKKQGKEFLWYDYKVVAL